MEQIPELKKRYLVVNFIGLAMIASVFICAAPVEICARWIFLGPDLGAISSETADLLKYIFVGLSLGHYFLIRLFQGKMVEKNPRFLPQAAIITFALCQAVAIYGLVLFFLTRSSFNLYLFFALSLFYFYIFYPRYADWERVLGPGSPPSSPPA